MSQLKTRLQALSLLDRAFSCITDDELVAMVAALPDDHRTTLDELCGAQDGGFTDAGARTLALRSTAARGRMNGVLEQVTTVLTDPCLASCIEALGDHADNPTEDQLLAATPALVEQYGVPTVRLMMAAAVAGEAQASVMLTRLLKQHDEFKLPPAPAVQTSLLPVRQADDETKAKRKAMKDRKAAEAKARREQQLKARGR